MATISNIKFEGVGVKQNKLNCLFCLQHSNFTACNTKRLPFGRTGPESHKQIPSYLQEQSSWPTQRKTNGNQNYWFISNVVSLNPGAQTGLSNHNPWRINSNLAKRYHLKAIIINFLQQNSKGYYIVLFKYPVPSKITQLLHSQKKTMVTRVTLCCSQLSHHLDGHIP